MQLYTEYFGPLCSSICNSRSKPPATLANPGQNWSGFPSAITSTPPFVINSEWIGATAGTGRWSLPTKWPTSGGATRLDSSPAGTSG